MSTLEILTASVFSSTIHFESQLPIYLILFCFHLLPNVTSDGVIATKLDCCFVIEATFLAFTYGKAYTNDINGISAVILSKTANVSRLHGYHRFTCAHMKSVNTEALINTQLKNVSNVNTVSSIAYLFCYLRETKVINSEYAT